MGIKPVAQVSDKGSPQLRVTVIGIIPFTPDHANLLPHEELLATAAHLFQPSSGAELTFIFLLSYAIFTDLELIVSDRSHTSVLASELTFAGSCSPYSSH